MSQTTSPSHVHTPLRIVIRCMGAIIAFGRSSERRQWMRRRGWTRSAGGRGHAGVAPLPRAAWACNPRLAWARCALQAHVQCGSVSAARKSEVQEGLSFGVCKEGNSIAAETPPGEMRPARLLGGGGADAPCCACAARRRSPVGSPRALTAAQESDSTDVHVRTAVRAWGKKFYRNSIHVWAMHICMDA